MNYCKGTIMLTIYIYRERERELERERGILHFGEDLIQVTQSYLGFSRVIMRWNHRNYTL